MKDFIFFRRMLMPLLIQIAFWIAIILCLLTMMMDFSKGFILKGLEVLIIGPICARLMAELIILFFRMNETLTDIKNKISAKV